MSIIYLDTSALIKRYIRESCSNDVVTLLQGAEFVGTSALTQVEMASALSKAVRVGWLDENDAGFAWSSFLTHWTSFVRLDVSSGLFDRASVLVWEHSLRAYDATHLAVAQMWQETIGENILFATFDKNLWAAARKAGMAVWPDNLVVE